MNKQGIALWIVIISVLVLDIGINCVRAQDDSSKAIKTQELQIVDSNGKAMIDLRVSPTGYPVVAMNDPDGHVRMGLVVLSDGPHAATLDENGKSTLVISGGAEPGLNIFKAGKAAAEFALLHGTDPSLGMQDDAGNDRVYLAYRPSTDSSTLHLTDNTQKQMAEITQSPNYAIVDVTDKANNRRAALRCTASGGAGVYLAGANGATVWSKTDPSGQ
jgi:hypothetical protein